MYITKLHNCQLINLAICATTEQKMSIVCWGTSHFRILLRLTETQLNVRLTFWHRDLSGHSPPLRTTFFSLGISILVRFTKNVNILGTKQD